MSSNQNIDFEEALLDSLAKDQDLDYLELPLSRRAFILLGVIIGAVVFAFTSRLVFLNIIKAGFYQNRAEANMNKEVIMPAYRGIITDRFGEVLVENSPSFSVFLNAAELLKNKDNLELVIQKLNEVLETNSEEIRAKFQSVDLKRQNLVAVARNITSDQIIALKSLNLSGVTVDDDYSRFYQDGKVFSRLIGYDGEIRTGLESVYDDYLKGQDGISLIFKDVRGNTIGKKSLQEAVAGSDLELTVDAGLQRFFYDRLNGALRSLGSSAGVGMALNPQNGELLALVSLPSFDNNFFVGGGFNREKQRLLNDPAKPLFNRAVSGLYSPGSTIKPLVALAALKEQLIDPDWQIFSRGYLEVPNPYDAEKPSRFLDWKPNSWVDLRSALARSSNIYFYAIGGGLPPSELSLLQGAPTLKGLGIYKLYQYWKKFLLDQKSGIDLPAENSGFLPDPEEKERRKRHQNN